MDAIKYIFFDIGYTLANEDEVWRQRCIEQAETAECKALGLTPEKIFDEILQNANNYMPQYRTLVSKYKLAEKAPYRYEFEMLYSDAFFVLQKLSKKYKLGIIANQDHGLLERLASFGIAEFFLHSYIVR